MGLQKAQFSRFADEGSDFSELDFDELCLADTIGGGDFEYKLRLEAEREEMLYESGYNY